MNPLRLICWMMGHKWRRLRKAERHDGREPMSDDNYKRTRICRRCSETRFAKARKAKP